MSRFILLFTTLLSICFCACNDDEKKDAIFKAKVEKTRTALANQCTQDSDCVLTGCRNNMCRAVAEPEYCDQRVVFALDHAEDLGTVKTLIEEQLTVRESESVRIGGYAAGLWTLSFSAEMSQRERLIETLNTISMSGFARLHPASEQYSTNLLQSLNDPDASLKSMRGAGKLVEKQIRSGDVLSKDDIHNTWTQVSSTLSQGESQTDQIERMWAYDVIVDKVSHLRLWPVDKRQRIPMRLWSDVELRTDNGDIVFTATVAEEVAPTLEKWSQDGKIILVLLGNEVIASALPQKTIQNGRFELVIHNAAQNDSLLKSMSILKAVAQMKGTLRIDEKSTRKVERDITCQEKYPRTCACVAGTCGWKNEADYNACLYNINGNEEY